MNRARVTIPPDGFNLIFKRKARQIVIPVRVECYSGYKGEERPVRFFIGQRTLNILEIDDRWYSPDAIYFRVHTDDGNVYLLRHDEIQDIWSLEAFRYR